MNFLKASTLVMTSCLNCAETYSTSRLKDKPSIAQSNYWSIIYRGQCTFCSKLCNSRLFSPETICLNILTYCFFLASKYSCLFPLQLHISVVFVSHRSTKEGISKSVREGLTIRGMGSDFLPCEKLYALFSASSRSSSIFDNLDSYCSSD